MRSQNRLINKILLFKQAIQDIGVMKYFKLRPHNLVTY